MNALQPTEAMARHLGRVVIGAFYVVNGIGLLMNFSSVTELMRLKHVPFASALLVLVISLWLAGGGCIVAGYRARQAALALLAVTIPVTLGIHAPWLADAANFQNELNHFLKNLAILGALLLLAAAPPVSRPA